MTRLLLDTTFLIDADRYGADLTDAVADDDDVAIAAVTVAELRVGALLADRRRKAARTTFVDDVLATLQVIDYDLTVAEAHAALLAQVRSQGRPRGAHDLIIAATARALHRTVVTADQSAVEDLDGVDLRLHR